MSLSDFKLNGQWKLYYKLEDGNMPDSIDEVKARQWPTIPASVPGNVELDLVSAGIEPDPYVGNNLYRFRQYEFYQWWFEREFDVPDSVDLLAQQAFLVLNGLDTFGTIWINGTRIGDTDNMLVEHEFDVTPHLRPGQANHIAIRIASPLNRVRGAEFPENVYGGEHGDELVWLRKPPSSFGWDIAPRLVSAGIWRDIGIAFRNPTRLTGAYYATTSLQGNHAGLTVRYRFTTDEPILDGFSVRLSGECGDSRFVKTSAAKFCSDWFKFDVPDARLWWPAGYGEPHLYEVTLQLLHNGRVIDTRKDTIGIRAVEFETKYAEGDDGEFRIKINDVPILVKGTNWVPLDAMHSRDAGRLDEAHRLMVDIGCNMVRCWGGNVYEDHAFFELCDRHGIMVWQDFALACAVYPQNDEFAGVIEKEAAKVITKLRNHASLVCWAGDNEIDQIYEVVGYKLPHARHNRINRELLPRAVGSYDPYRMYIPSSPYVPEHMYGIHNVPEQHNWGPRDYFKGDYYKHTSAHFISEIGYHGCPAPSSIRKFITPDKVWPMRDNDEWATHNTEYIRWNRRGYDRNELMANQVKILFGSVPDDLESFVLASQISQAEAKKYFIEMVRLKKWRRTGVIWWNLLDCWPQFSDAIVDYYFEKKLAYPYIQRVQQPVCLMMGELESWHHPVILGNDSRTSGNVRYRVEDGDTGETLLEGETFSPANENVQVGVVKSWEGRQKLYLLSWTFEGATGANHYVSGYVPFELEQYKKWLAKIESLSPSFQIRQ